MQSAVETLSPTRVRLTVEVPFAELKPELDGAYRKIGAQVKVQGFRPGKVPPRILDQRVGRATMVDEAVQEAVPRLYGEAVEQTGVSPVSRPQVEVTELTDNDKLAFTAEVDVRPEITLPSYETLQVTVDAIDVGDDDVATQLEEIRKRFASLTPVERVAESGDFLTLDLAATVDGEEVPGGTATELSYELGSGSMLAGMDEALVGVSAGDARSFTTVLVGGEFAGRDSVVAATVRAVNQRELPDLDDAWASDAAGFGTLEELRADVRVRLEGAKRLEQGVEARDKVLAALLAGIDVPLPESVVTSQLEWRKQAGDAQLASNGLSLQEYLDNEGKTEQEWNDELAADAREAVKTELVLEAVADAEQIGVTEAELRDQLIRRSQRSGMPPEQFAAQLVETGQLPAMAAEVRRGKGLAMVMGAATITDSRGEPVDLERLSEAAGEDAAGVEVDEDGRRFHVHPDGEVHYFEDDPVG